MQLMPLEVHKIDGIIKANGITQYAAECSSYNGHIECTHVSRFIWVNAFAEHLASVCEAANLLN